MIGEEPLNAVFPEHSYARQLDIGGRTPALWDHLDSRYPRNIHLLRDSEAVIHKEQNIILLDGFPSEFKFYTDIEKLRDVAESGDPRVCMAKSLLTPITWRFRRSEKRALFEPQRVDLYFPRLDGDISRLCSDEPLNTNTRFSRLDFENMSRTVARGIDLMHSLGFLHRDIKMENVGFKDFEEQGGKRREFFVMDFGDLKKAKSGSAGRNHWERRCFADMLVDSLLRQEIKGCLSLRISLGRGRTNVYDRFEQVYGREARQVVDAFLRVRESPDTSFSEFANKFVEALFN
jgi:hypothetical protein